MAFCIPRISSVLTKTDFFNSHGILQQSPLVVKLAAMRQQAGIILLLFLCLALGACRKAEQKPIMRGKDWEDVRSVVNPFGGTQDFVLIPEAKQRDKEYYKQVSETICGQRNPCMVDFWTDKNHIPNSASIAVEDLAVQTASYERSPLYREPHLHLACWLYASKTVGEADKCEYEPGARIPPGN